MKLEFGLASFTQKSTYMEPIPFPRLYDQTIEEAVLAEQLGFDVAGRHGRVVEPF